MEILLSLITSIVGNLLGSVFVNPNTNIVQESSEIEVTETLVEYESIIYQLHWYRIENPDSVELEYNLDNLHTAQEAFQLNNCNFLINGGFYSTDNKPIGWFHTQTSTLSASQRNFLFNGYLFITNTNQVEIDSKIPEQTPRLGLQTGPILFDQGQIQKLVLNQDKAARRSVAITTSDNSLLFGMITTSGSDYSGPYLRDLPSILELMAIEIGIDIHDAINLDGGGASAFISPDVKIAEVSPIGSYFCVKN